MSMKQEFTAHDMATAAADGFRDGQRASAELAATLSRSMSKAITGLPKRLRIKASMIALGERIAWGSDTALMEEAADVIEALIASVENHQLHMLGMARDRDQLRAMLAAIQQAEGEDAAVLASVSMGGVEYGIAGAELGDIDIEPDMKALRERQQALVTGEDDAHVELIDKAQHQRIVAALSAQLRDANNLADQWAEKSAALAAQQRTQAAGVPDAWRDLLRRARRFVEDWDDDSQEFMDLCGEIDNALAAAPAQPEVQESASLDERMRAAGMMTVADLLAGAPLDAFTKHAGVNDLASLLQWAEMRRAECLKMQARYDLGERDKGDDLYEWTIAHCAVFTEMHVNIRAALAGQAAHDQGEVQRLRVSVPEGWQLVPVEMARKLVRTYENAIIDAAHWTDMDYEVAQLRTLLASHAEGEA